jgi:hypothetical protein
MQEWPSKVFKRPMRALSPGPLPLPREDDEEGALIQSSIGTDAKVATNKKEPEALIRQETVPKYEAVPQEEGARAIVKKFRQPELEQALRWKYASVALGVLLLISWIVIFAFLAGLSRAGGEASGTIMSRNQQVGASYMFGGDTMYWIIWGQRHIQ